MITFFLIAENRLKIFLIYIFPYTRKLFFGIKSVIKDYITYNYEKIT